MNKILRKLANEITLNKMLAVAGVLAVVFLVIFWFWWGKNEISINNGDDGSQVKVVGEPITGITGIDCENAHTRPLAVMMSSDPQTRPLSGIASADIVFEMPVTPGGVTRMMAVFQCEEPGEVGSIRSAREDFIPLAAGLGATYAHWGGEREALTKLNGHIIDNIDAMKYENVYFFRKSGIKQPHNGFADYSKLKRAVDELKYPRENKFFGYPHDSSRREANLMNIGELVKMDYPAPFNVEWVYNKETGVYRRFRDGRPEVDRNSDKQVEAGVVIVMEAGSSFSNKDYLTVNTTGEGGARIYQGGIEMPARWSKDPSRLDSKLFFLDADRREISFVPGKIWVQVITKN